MSDQIGAAATADLDLFPEDWGRALVVVAHPDDMEYGGASAVARWTSQGKDVRYLLVTRGEAGIESMSPSEVAPIREAEQRASCGAVGVSVVEFLAHPDGLVVNDLVLRRDIAEAIRRHQPEVVLSINFRDSWGGPSWNHADHRAVGEALLDAVRDAANSWVFTGAGGPPWSGVRFVAFSGSPRPTHGVDVTESMDAGVESLRCHALYLENLDGDMADPSAFLHSHAHAAGPRIGAVAAATFEIINL